MGDNVRAEREAILAAIQEEHVAVLAAIAEERTIILDALMDEAFTREVNKMFARGLVLIGLFLAGFAVMAFLGVRALKNQKS